MTVTGAGADASRWPPWQDSHNHDSVIPSRCQLRNDNLVRVPGPGFGPGWPGACWKSCIPASGPARDPGLPPGPQGQAGNGPAPGDRDRAGEPQRITKNLNRRRMTRTLQRPAGRVCRRSPPRRTGSVWSRNPRGGRRRCFRVGPTQRRRGKPRQAKFQVWAARSSDSLRLRVGPDNEATFLLTLPEAPDPSPARAGAAGRIIFSESAARQSRRPSRSSSLILFESAQESRRFKIIEIFRDFESSGFSFHEAMRIL